MYVRLDSTRIIVYLQIIFTVWQMFCWGVEIFGSKSFGGKSLVLV